MSVGDEAVKSRIAVLVVLMWLAMSPRPQLMAQAGADTTAAQTAATRWLSLVDTLNYGASWDAAASAFRAAVTREQWDRAARSARGPFGDLKTRALKSANATSSLPGAPDGEYVAMQFDAAFERKAAAVETVVTVRDTDGAGYFVR